MKQKRNDMPRRRSLFWDVDSRTVDPNKHARYIIARIFEFGRDSEVRWLWDLYPKSFICDVVYKSGVLRR